MGRRTLVVLAGAAAVLLSCAGLLGGAAVIGRLLVARPAVVEALAHDVRARVEPPTASPTMPAPSAVRRVVPGPAGTRAAAADPAEVAARLRRLAVADRRSVVRVTGVATACSQMQEGSGVVVARGLVVTNAHVVEGLTAVLVQADGTGPRYRATVVGYDPAVDVAVLAVPRLRAPALPLRTAVLPDGSAVEALGFPGGGPLRASPGTVDGLAPSAGPQVGSARPAPRPVYSVAATVRPGNSGGPLLAADGTVAGIVFARGDRLGTGFVIASSQVVADLRAVGASSGPVSTGVCTRG